MKLRLRDTVIAASIVVAVMAQFAGALPFRPHPPSAERCAALWNATANAPIRQASGVAGFKRAVVAGWFAEEVYPGCSVLLVERAREPWILFVAWVPEQGPAHWDRVDGEDWGIDSPEGGQSEPNASVSESGRVDLYD